MDTRMRGLPSGSRIAFVLRLAASLAILIVVVSRVSIAELAVRAAAATAAPMAAAVVIFSVMAVLVAVRWRLIARWLSLVMPMALAVRAVFLGLFGGQVLPSALGTDLLRGWVVFRSTGRMHVVAASLVADRMVALFAACALAALSHPSLSRLPAPLAGFVAPAALLVSGVVLAALLLACTKVPGAMLRRRVRFLRELDLVEGGTLRAKPLLAAIGFALAIQAMAVVAAALIAAGYGIDASLGVWLSIIPLSIIASALPVSINGWGVREAVIVALAAAHGIAQVDALLVSLTLGALNMIASLPGGYLLLRQPRA